MASTSSGVVVVSRRDPLASTIAWRKMARLPSMAAAEAETGERVPAALAPSVIPILRAADEIERLPVADEIERLRSDVANLCRKYAYKKAQSVDPLSSQRGVRQFKTYLSYRINQDNKGPDASKIQEFYEYYYEKCINKVAEERKSEEMAKHYQVAAVLYGMLRDEMKDKVDPKVISYAREVERESVHFKHKYNILPLKFSGSSVAIMELQEIKDAVSILREIDGLPMPSVSLMLGEGDQSVQDLLDWLMLTFGFQKGNVENQREHLILLLANIDTRTKDHESHSLGETLNDLGTKIFENYNSWCRYLHRESSIKFPSDAAVKIKQQLELLYIGLYLLIWGEASNVRFMPECLCYIFHRMASQLYEIIFENNMVRRGSFKPPSEKEESFLHTVIQPIYEVMRKEAQKNVKGTAAHSSWRNYDDLNEYFWSNKCFKLDWPWDLKADFFFDPHKAMLIVSWSSPGSLSAIVNPDVFRSVLSIFITAALLNFLKATLEIILGWHAWGNMKCTQIIRYLLKFIVAIAWIIILAITYSSSIQNPTGLAKFLSNLVGNWHNQFVYYFAIIIYMIPNIVGALLFLLPQLHNAMECSNWRIVTVLMWWIQPKLYVARGMHENTWPILKYTFFWILLLICKLAFSYYVEISPMVKPTKYLLSSTIGNYEWHQVFPFLPHNLGVVITVWAPIIMVYFMDTQIWYAIFSTIFGGVIGAFNRMGEIRALHMLRARFKSVPSAFQKCLLPANGHIQHSSKNRSTTNEDKLEMGNFFHIWNSFIISLREEDLISDREKDLLIAPSSSGDVSVDQWPPFLLASKVSIALDMAKNFKGEDDELKLEIKLDQDMFHAIKEFYESLKKILDNVLSDDDDKTVVTKIYEAVDCSIREKTFLQDFRMNELPNLSNMLEKLLNLLKSDNVDSQKRQIVTALQDLMEIVTRDVMTAGQGILNNERDGEPGFANLDWNLIKEKSWREKFARLYLLLTMKDSAMDVPTNLDAQRRITFFVNSLFMKMPRAPKVCDMISFSVLTPYFNEEVLYSAHELNKKNEDGISILFYLQKIYPDEWKNFLERIQVDPQNEEALKGWMDDICVWASYRGQTLARTVRGMMYYRRALQLQCSQDSGYDQAPSCGQERGSTNRIHVDSARSEAIADIKFTYVVSCQLYGVHKASKDSRSRNLYENILNLMLTYPSLRIAYIDEVTINDRGEKCYYSVLVKGVKGIEQYEEEIYRIKLPGKPTDVGEGKPNNQNHAIIFTRGEALQAIDMNQENYLEEAFKMRNLLQEFKSTKYSKSWPTILGLREHIFTGSVSSLAWFMSNQETSFVTIGQRVLADPLKVRFHYGHPDVFDRIFHVTRGGISKASKVINLSEDIFAGFNSTMRGGNVTHHEYMQVGKGRDVGMNQISNFEAKVANGNGEQTLSRDVYRLGSRFDFYRMLSFYFTTVGFYFSSMVTVLTVYVFLYGRLYLVLSGLDKSILNDSRIKDIKPFQNALATQSVFQLGLVLVLPMVMEVGLEKGFGTAVAEFVVMQLQLASVFFTFHLGTKTHYYGRTILHGGAKYRPTGRGFVVRHAKFAENYRMYSRSHFVKGLELLILLVVYLAYGHSYRSSSLYAYVTSSIWFLVVSWLFAPFIFNPSGFEWHKTVDDWADWWKWMRDSGGIGVPAEQSWEAWWISEQEHLQNTTIQGLLLEIILSLRFLIYQYGIVYHLNIAHRNRSIQVYALSWVVIAFVLLVLKVVSIGRERFGTSFQLMFRIVKFLIFLAFIGLMIILFVAEDLTIWDIFASILAFMPTGWFILLVGQLCGPLLQKMVMRPICSLHCSRKIGQVYRWLLRRPRFFRMRQACRPLLKIMGPWDSIQELARMYEYMMGIIIFFPIAVLSWFPIISEFQTRLLFNQAFSRGLQISRILAGQKETTTKIE